uniref:CUB domain-containing protein n=1 Tax=Caenorhabditis tropicalis TaxID=1561998 RepID=A0A1I7T6L6_9PELO
MIGMCSSASLYKDVVDSRQWMSNPCDEKMPFVCQRAKNGYPCAPDPTQSPENPVTFEPVIPTSPPDDPRMCFHPLFFTGSGTIYSPYYPNNYTSVYSSPCKYVITVPAGTIAQIQFSPESYIRYSKMEFYSQLEDGQQFANFTGHPPPYPLNSTTNVIKMVFTIYSDKQDVGVQWVASYGNNLTLV